VVRSLRQREWLWALLLFAFVFVAYLQVLHAGFIWDDESHLTRNPAVIGPLGLKEIWTTTQAVYYPLVLTTFWALHKLVGLNPLPYHLLNVLLHAGSAILLWRVLRLLRIRGAWLGAALWALHPVMVQSVAWITELKNTQSCLFYLLSILFFLRCEEERPRVAPISRLGSSTNEGRAVSGPPQWRTRDRRFLMLFALSLLFFVLATLSKPSVVMLPVVLALCIWWMRGKIRWRDAFTVAPFAVISALASAWTIWEQKFHAGAVGPDWAQTLPERFIIAGRAIWFYLGKLIWPHPLIFIYPRWAIHPTQMLAWLPLVAGIAAVIALWLTRAQWARAAFFAVAYYVVSLFPVLGFFSVYFFRYSFVSDHFQYLASMGPLALAGAGLSVLGGRLTRSFPLSGSGGAPVHVARVSAAPFSETSRNLASDTDAQQLPGDISAAARTKAFLAPVLCSVPLLLLAFLTWRQTAEYRDLISLYTATLKKNPACWMAHYNLGIALGERGEIDQAIDHYRQAIALRPNYSEAHYNLGRLLVAQGRLDEAITHYEKAVAINPADAEAQNNLGVTLYAVGRVDDAIQHYRKALEIRPDYAAASCNLADALIATGDVDGAIARYSACLAAMPNQPEAEYNLASALLRKGRTDEAIVHYRKVLQLRPESADAHANLGSALLAKARVHEAIAEYRKAIEISPENVAALSSLAWLLATSADPGSRNGSEAVKLAQRADAVSSRSPRHPIVLRILAAAYAEAGRFSEARETAQQALKAANTQGNSTLANSIRDEIALYELGLPCHK
jgi:tetratricopeptide (TPR) repeat protein